MKFNLFNQDENEKEMSGGAMFGYALVGFMVLVLVVFVIFAISKFAGSKVKSDKQPQTQVEQSVDVDTDDTLVETEN